MVGGWVSLSLGLCPWRFPGATSSGRCCQERLAKRGEPEGPWPLKEQSWGLINQIQKRPRGDGVRGPRDPSFAGRVLRTEPYTPSPMIQQMGPVGGDGGEAGALVSWGLSP